MPRDSADLFLECIEAFNRMDIPGVLRYLDPTIKFDHRLTELQGTYTGLEGVKGLFEDVAEHFDALKIDCPDVRDLGDRVLALGTARITGSAPPSFAS